MRGISFCSDHISDIKLLILLNCRQNYKDDAYYFKTRSRFNNTHTHSSPSAQMFIKHHSICIFIYIVELILHTEHISSQNKTFERLHKFEYLQFNNWAHSICICKTCRTRERVSRLVMFCLLFCYFLIMSLGVEISYFDGNRFLIGSRPTEQC